MRSTLFVLLLASLFGLLACSRSEQPAPEDQAAAQRTTTNQGKGLESARPDPPKGRQVAVLAGGCFWGMEELIRKQPGVLDTTVGYTGGSFERPEYGDVSSGRSGHAEAVRIEFDPTKTSYERLLLYFFTIHDPTTENRQGNDVGSQYRSAIFVQNAEQRRIAERVKQRVATSGDWKGPITTEIADAGTFYPAEDYHQDYLQKNPGGYSCHYERETTFY